MPQVPMFAQLYEGRGVDITSGKVFGKGIEFDPLIPLTTGQDISFSLESVSTSRELSDKLNISATASVTMAKWGASAEFQLAKSQQINRYYTYALVRHVVKNPAVMLRNPRFLPEAINLLRQGWDAFATSYGWYYVEGLITGGSYYGLIEVQTENESEQRDIKVKIGANVGSFSANVRAEDELKAIGRSAITNVFVARSGGSGGVVQIELEAMIEEAKNFAIVVRDHPVTTTALISDYRSTVPLPQGIPEPDSLLRRRQKDTLEELARYYQKFRDYKGSVQFVLDRNMAQFDEYRQLNEQQLEEKRVEYEQSLENTADELDRIVSHAERCADDVRQCETYVPGITLLSLPRIGGDVMNMKEMTDKITALENALNKLKSGADSVTHMSVIATPENSAGDSSSMINILSRKPDPPYVSWIHGNQTPIRYGYVQGGHFKNGRKAFVLTAEQEANLDLHTSADFVLWAKNIYMHGPITTDGDLQVNRIGTSGFSPAPMRSNWKGGVHTWDVEAEGTIWCANNIIAKNFVSEGADLAENYPSADDLKRGDVVCLDPNGSQIVRSVKADEHLVLGVISSCPGVVLNGQRDTAQRNFPVAICGRVPCKVVDENGPIKPGDLLTTSSTPGHAMKAGAQHNNGEYNYRPGTIIGKALASLCTRIGIIDVFVLIR